MVKSVHQAFLNVRHTRGRYVTGVQTCALPISTGRKMNLFVLVWNLFKAGVSCRQSSMEGMPEKNKMGNMVHEQIIAE